MRAGAAAAPKPAAPSWPGIGLAATGSIAVLALLRGLPDPALPWVLLVAMALGAALVLLDFGFTAGFRALVAGSGAEPFAAALMVPAVAALVIIPVADGRDDYGRYVAPIGMALVLGAALFGVGMQLANGCGSGTLVAAGQGARRMWVALPFFCLGGVPGGILLPAALRLPAIGVIDLPAELGRWGGLAATELLIALAALLLLRGGLPPRRLLPAPAAIGALAALLFLVSGDPWGVTAALALWGAHAVQAVGLDLSGTDFWSSGWGGALLAQPVLMLHSSVSNLGLLLGALAAAAARGSLRHHQPIGGRGALGAAIGGLLMGVGARLSFGCNVGAFLGGTASGSLHGPVWALAALAGSWAGVRARPWFGMSRA
jgi:uncharacterized membrane protein YedE/YeeE